MLAKKYRLPIQSFVGKHAKIVKSRYFLAKIFSTKSFSRFGVTVSAKVAKKATERNYLKRLAYNFIREHYNKAPLADYWITVLPSALVLPKERFVEELQKLLITNN